jgi:YesN/AraC family two-component response regulator
MVLMKRLLLVEDNRMERNLIFHILQEQFKNYVKIDEVSAGTEALTYLLNFEYDLVITDLIMPQFDGIELIRKIKNDLPTYKIIAISGSRPYYLYIAKKIGVNSVFTKPLDKNLFINAVTEILAIKKDKTTATIDILNP